MWLQVSNGREAQNARLPSILGWLAVTLATLVTSFWAFWGAIENFHEGWYLPTLWQNLALMFVQYLSPMLVCVLLTLIGLRWPKVGGSILFVTGIWFNYLIFHGRDFSWSTLLSWLPATGLLPLAGVLFWFGRPQPKQWSYRVAVGVPLAVAAVCAAEPVWRVSSRIDDGNREAQLVEGDGVRLIWAPAGPGWPNQGGVSWDKARRTCRFLSADGKEVMDQPQAIWRLPTVDEAARSMARHGRNCGGQWNPQNEQATYQITPDKESPLWDTTSPIIYWWTATETNESEAYRIVYHGGVYASRKNLRMGSLAFRAVKEAAE